MMEQAIREETNTNTEKNRTRKMLFAFFPAEGHGHINPAISMANELRKRGHDTVFFCINDIGSVDNHRVICLKKLREQKQADNNITEGSQEISEADGRMVKQMQNVGYGARSRYKILIDLYENWGRLTNQLSDPVWNQLLREVIIDSKPDVVIVDHAFVIPAIMTPSHKQKWVKVHSANPLRLYGQFRPGVFPAPYLGVSVGSSTETELAMSWQQYHTASTPILPLAKSLADEAQLKLSDFSYMVPDSPYLNLYTYPRELDYDQELGHPLEGWVRIQCMNRPKPEIQRILDGGVGSTKKSLLRSLDIPEDLRDFVKLSLTTNLAEEGKKLIFLSLGTIACMDVAMMERIVRLLASTPYQIIVSKGARHNEFSLAANMWGAKHVPQKEILLLVDLVVTHGGNNTITECLYSGVSSIIVCPMFCDQFDNATRMEEKHLAATVDLSHPESDQLLLDTIETVLVDTVMRDNIERVSQELRQPNEGPEKAAKLIEKLGLEN